MKHLLAKRLTKKKWLSFLAGLLRSVHKILSRECWEFKRSSTIKSIWAFHLWLGEAIKLALATLKKGCGRSYKVGKGNFCLKQEEKS